MHRAIVGGLVGLSLIASVAAAHEQSLHKGRPTEGEVVSVSEERLVLKTSKGTVPVTLSETTHVERGTGEATRKDIRQGDHVSVFGTTLASGEIVAREIVIHPAGGAGEHHGGRVHE